MYAYLKNIIIIYKFPLEHGDAFNCSTLFSAELAGKTWFCWDLLLYLLLNL